MKQKGFLLVAVVSAMLVLASCSGFGGKASESGVESAQESSVESAAQQGNDVASASVQESAAESAAVQESGAESVQESATNSQESIEVASSESEASAASSEASEPAKPRWPSEKSIPGDPFPEPAPDPTPIPNDPVLHGYNRIELSGNRNDHVITDKYCYLRSDKYVMFFEDNLDLPGDLKKNVDLIMDTIEDVVGVPFNAEKFKPIPGNYTHFDHDPWEGIELNKRVAIHVYVDHEDVGYICSADAENVTIFMYELYTDKFWNSVPSYRDNAWRRSDYIDYYIFAHELTHALTTRYATMSEIMTEGMADYVAMEVMERLKDTSSDFQKSLDHMYFNFEYRIAKDVTKDTIEEIFTDDLSELEYVNRTDKYTLGRMIGSYLSESYGESFLRDYMDAVSNLGDRFDYCNMSRPQKEKYTQKFKQLFGDDVFVGFAEWYKKNAKETMREYIY